MAFTPERFILFCKSYPLHFLRQPFLQNALDRFKAAQETVNWRHRWTIGLSGAWFHLDEVPHPWRRIGWLLWIMDVEAVHWAEHFAIFDLSFVGLGIGSCWVMWDWVQSLQAYQNIITHFQISNYGWFIVHNQQPVQVMYFSTELCRGINVHR